MLKSCYRFVYHYKLIFQKRKLYYVNNMILSLAIGTQLVLLIIFCFKSSICMLHILSCTQKTSSMLCNWYIKFQPWLFRKGKGEGGSVVGEYYSMRLVCPVERVAKCWEINRFKNKLFESALVQVLIKLFTHLLTIFSEINVIDRERL